MAKHFASSVPHEDTVPQQYDEVTSQPYDDVTSDSYDDVAPQPYDDMAAGPYGNVVSQPYDVITSEPLEVLSTDTYEEEGSGKPFWLELLQIILGTLVLAIAIRLFVAETFQVPTGSMLETIQLGDLLVGEKVTLHFDPPQRGDIVTFIDPDGSGTTLIKRVIATEGQVVDLQDGNVVVDGEVLSEDYVLGKPSYPITGHAANLTEDLSYPYTVPEGCLWVMGDNRTVSLDSRYFGAVPVKSVTSKALFIYWPFSDIGTL